MDAILERVTSKDIKERLQGAAELEEIAQKGGVELGDADVILKALPKLLKDNNAKVCQNSVSTLAHMVTQLGEDFRPYIGTFASLLVERMADTKPATRERTLDVVLALADVTSPSSALDTIKACWKHKNYRAREQILETWVALRNHFGSDAVAPGSYIDDIVKLLGDQKASVRDAAMKCLDDIYSEWGQKLVHILTNKGIRSATLSQIQKRFETVDTPANGAGMGGGTSAHSDPTPLSERQRTASSSSLGGRKKERITLTPTGDQSAPVIVSSGKELSSKLSKLASTLSSASNPWDQRLEALHQLSALMRGNASEYDELIDALRSLVDPLITSVSDLRSQISRAGCEAVSTMAKILGPSFDAVAESLMPALLKLPFVSVQVIALSGAACIREVLTYCQSSRIIPHILKALKGRNTELRVHCIGYLNQILRMWPKSTMDRHAATMQEILSASLKDASGDVRKTARHAFWSFSHHYESRALRIHGSLDPQAQKVLEKSQHDVEASTPVDENLVHDFAMTSSQPERRQGSRGSSRGSRERPSAAKPARPSQAQLEAAAALPAHEAPQDISSVPSRHAPPARRTQTPSSAVNYDEIPVGGGGGGYAGGYADIHAQPRHHGRPPITVRTDAFADDHGHGHGRDRGLVDDDDDDDEAEEEEYGYGRAAPAQQQQQASRRPARAAPRAASASSASSRRAPPSHASAARTTGAASKQSRSRARRASTEVESHSNGGVNGVGGASNVVDFSGEDLPSVFLKADSEIWSTRIEAFVQIKTIVQTMPSKTVHPHFKKLISVFDEHLPDPHYKVTMQAFDTLCEVMNTYRTSLEPYLERLVPKILLKLSDAKQMVRASAGRALEALGECYETDILFPLLLRILEHRNPKVKQSALEFVLGLARVDPAYFETGSHMRGYLLRLSGFCKDKNPDLRKVAMHILLDLYQGHNRIFVTQLVQLPTGVQHELQGKLKSQIPDISQVIRQAKEELRYGAAAGAAAHPSGRRGQEASPSQYRDYDPYQAAAAAASGGGSRRAPLYEEEYEEDFEEYDEDYTHPPPQRSAGTRAASGRDIHQPTTHPTAGPEPWARRSDNHLQQQQQQRPMPGLKPRSQGTPAHPASGPSNTRTQYNGPFPHPASPQRQQQQQPVPVSSSNTAPSYNPRAYQEKELLVSDPDDPTQVVPQLLSQVSMSDDPSTRAEAVHRLIKLSRGGKPAVWSQFFGRILLVVLEAANDRDSGVRELAVLLIKEMLRNQQHAFSDFLEVVMSRLLECYRDPAREVTQAGEDALGQLIKSQPVQRCLEVLIPTIISEDGPVLLGGLKALSKIVKAMPPHDLLSQLPAILPGVFEAFKNPNADIRKAVVFCLVDMYLVLGDKFTPFLGELNTSQLKLVTIYINRLVKTR